MNRGYWIGIGVGVSLIAAALALPNAHGREGWQGRPLVCDPKVLADDEVKACTAWIKGVRMPDQVLSCCGEADAYVADSFEVGSNGEYVAIISRDYPTIEQDDGEGGTIITPGIPQGTKVIIPPNKVNNGARDGNPTGHGIVFMDSGRRVLCYFSPTLASLQTKGGVL